MQHLTIDERPARALRHVEFHCNIRSFAERQQLVQCMLGAVAFAVAHAEARRLLA